MWGKSPEPWTEVLAVETVTQSLEELPAPPWTAADVLAAGTGARHAAAVTCIFRYEIGGVGYDPYARHMDARVYGPGGLAEFGLLPQFRAWGYTDPYSPYQVAEYIDRVIDEGRAGSNWPEVGDGRCPGR